MKKPHNGIAMLMGYLDIYVRPVKTTILAREIVNVPMSCVKT
jgi:hypothetical protein